MPDDPDNDRRARTEGPFGYRERHYGQAGGYGQAGPGLDYDGPRPFGPPDRVPPSPEFPGHHLGPYEARHYRERVAREPDDLAPPDPRAIGRHPRFSEDGFDDDRIAEGRGHRGRAPRNYVRADERIAEDVNQRLTDDDWLDPTDIEVSVDQGVVTLAGTVDSRADKRRAEDLAAGVSGVHDVMNSLRIRPERYGTAPLGLP